MVELTKETLASLRAASSPPSNEELLTAWAEIKGVYPNLDTETSRAIEHHLCGFDVI